MNETYKDFLLTVAYVYMQNAKWDHAIRLLRALKIFWPQDAQVARCLAFSSVHAGDGETAMRECDIAFGINPEGIERESSILLKSQALWISGRKEEAQEQILGAFQPQTTP